MASRQTVIVIKRLIRNHEARKGEIEAKMAELGQEIQCLDCVIRYLEVEDAAGSQTRSARTVRLR